MRVYNTQGIVLDSLAYSEHAIIVRIYTLAYGMHSYLVRGVRKPHSRTAALYQPLVALDMVVSHRSQAGFAICGGGAVHARFSAI